MYINSEELASRVGVSHQELLSWVGQDYSCWLSENEALEVTEEYSLRFAC